MAILNNDFSLFHNDHSFRFLKIIEMGMKSKKLSLNITASFVKVLLKLTLLTDSSTALILSLVIFNITKMREGIRHLFKVS